jgi:NAD(P)-dependent dehydrogenase (short-subunit alcohol dehydrogenase family)
MNNRIAVVTGTSSGIGAATARLLLERGWTVRGVARRPAAIDHPRYTHASIDLADVRGLAAAFDRSVAPALTGDRWERVALVNNAARGDLFTGLERLEPADVLDMFAVNAVAPMWLMGFVVRHTPRGASLRIVNVSTGAAVTAFPGLAAYGASKAALRMAGQVFAAEFDVAERPAAGPTDTAFLSYQPGIVDTPMQTAARAADREAFPSWQLFQDFFARHALVDAAAPAAEIVAFLESDSAPRLTERRLGAQ